MKKPLSSEDFKTLKDYSWWGAFCLYALGVVYYVLYYLSFNIYVIPYLSLSEILLSSLFFILTMLLAAVAVRLGCMALYYFPASIFLGRMARQKSGLKKKAWKRLAQEEQGKFRNEVSDEIIDLAPKAITAINGLMISVMIISQFFVKSHILVLFSLGTVLSLIPRLYHVESSHEEGRKENKKNTVKLSLFTILALAVMATLFAGLTSPKKVKNGDYLCTYEIVTEYATYSSEATPEVVYVGETHSAVFLYDRSTENSLVINKSGIQVQVIPHDSKNILPPVFY